MRMRWLIGLLILIFSQPIATPATVAEYATVEQLFHDADIVAHGTVVAVAGAADGPTITTTATLEVIEFLKGDGSSPLAFTVLGGTANGTTLESAGAPPLFLDDEVIVALKFVEGRWWLMNESLGYLRIVEKYGRRHTSRDLRGFRFLVQSRPPRGFNKTGLADGRIEEQPLAIALQQPRMRKTFGRGEASSRRFQWWSVNQIPVPFRLNPGAFAAIGLGDLGSLEAALSRALGRWTNVPGSYLAYGFAGHSNVPPGTLDGTNVITTKGLSAVNPRIIGRAERWVNRITGQIADCDVAINSDRPDARDLGTVETVWSHELGHCAGLSHSADPAALMFDTYHDGAQLMPDDIAGLQRIYPVARRPASDGVPEIYIWPPTSMLAAGTINLEIHLLDAGGRQSLRRVYLGANGVTYTWVFLQYTAQVSYPTPHGWVLQFPEITFPQPGYSPMRITACLINDRGAEACQTATYTLW